MTWGRKLASLILGTAGHVDHGKTELVRALTGTDTDRLKEEKERGITIELGFAELAGEGRPHFGVVDVPGHDAFVRAMVAGAAGMDVVLLVVAGDEGVMPQTREHLAIVELLAVPELVVAITKCDTADAEWLDLVEADIKDVLSTTRYADATCVRTSALKETGLSELTDALSVAAGRVQKSDQDDLARLPLDRVFTIQGTGTVGTGTLWSGTIETGANVRLLPDNLDARIRSIEVHGRSSERAEAGDRTAVALTGDGGDRQRTSRGAMIVTHSGWKPTWMLTTRVQLISDTDWRLEHNQRVHVHHGTTEVLARCVLLEKTPLDAGASGWVQLRLEEPVVARAGDRLVIRAYSPVTTIGGGIIAEPFPWKRNSINAEQRAQLDQLVDGSLRERVKAWVELAGWTGGMEANLPIFVGSSPSACRATVDSMIGPGLMRAGPYLLDGSVIGVAEARVLEAVDVGHREDPLRVAIPLSRIRIGLPEWAPSELADAVIVSLCRNGAIERAEGGVRRAGFRPELTAIQQETSERLYKLLVSEGLAAPFIQDLPDDLLGCKDFWPILRHLESGGMLTLVADGLYVSTDEINGAIELIRRALAGSDGLGPADFREVLPVSRKHLIPLLNFFDGIGVTIRSAEGRSVPEV
jgi:selenocysteine-specific elongation factor